MSDVTPPPDPVALIVTSPVPLPPVEEITTLVPAIIRVTPVAPPPETFAQLNPPTPFVVRT